MRVQELRRGVDAVEPVTRSLCCLRVSRCLGVVVTMVVPAVGLECSGVGHAGRAAEG